jgi:hypothetical protein
MPGLNAFFMGDWLAASIPIEITFLVSSGSIIPSIQSLEAA